MSFPFLRSGPRVGRGDTECGGGFATGVGSDRECPGLDESWSILAILATLKGFYWLAVLASVWLFNDFDTEKFTQVNARWPREGGPSFASHFATWDAAHYLYLSEVGYRRDAPSCAFYPLWPLMVRWVAPVLGGNEVIAGLVLANVFSFAAWVLFGQLIARRWGSDAAVWSLLFLITFPGSLFFQFSYTESLFFVLLMLLWKGLEDDRQVVAGAAALLLPLTRGPGVFVVLPIAMYAAQPAFVWARECFMAHGARLSTFPLRAVGKRGWLTAVPVLGWVLYLFFMWSWTGNALEGFEAQKHWRVHSIWNLVDVPKFGIGFFTPTQWHEFTGSVLDRCVFILLLYALPVIWRLGKDMLVWTYVLGILPAMSGTFTSYTRFACCAFPLFIALGVALARYNRAWLRYAVLAIFTTLHMVLVWRFVNFRWAG